MARRDHTPGPPREVYTLRIGDDERRVVAAAAAQRGEPLSAFIRRAALDRARRELATVPAHADT